MKNNFGFNITRVGNRALLLEPYDNLDPSVIEPMIEKVTEIVSKSLVSTLYYDLNKTLIIDDIYYKWLCSLTSACSLFEVSLKVVNMKPTAAISLSSFIDKKPPFETVMEM